MKKNIQPISKVALILLFTFNFQFSTFNSFAQSPQSFQYQAVVRDASGNALQSVNVSFKLSIILGPLPGTVEYVETHSATTNIFGIATLAVGSGTPFTNLFSDVDWSTSPHFLKVEADPTGGGYINMGTTQLLSVPYALYAETSGNAVQTYAAGNGIDITGNVITNTSPNIPVSINAGTGTSVSGTYPNFVIDNTSPDQTVVINSGAGINVTSSYPNFTIDNLQPDQIVNLSGAGSTTVTGNYPNFVITSTGATVPYTAGSGIDVTGTVISNLAPDQTVILNGGSGINISSSYPSFTLTNTSPNETHTGDVTGSTVLTIANYAVTNSKILDGVITASKLSSMSATSGQVLKYNGSNWAPANDASNTYTGGVGITLNGSAFDAQTTTALWNANKLQGNTVASTTPTSGQVLAWNGTNWTPTADANNTYTGGTGITLSGSAFNAQTTTALWNANQLQGNAIASTAPTSGQVLSWNGTNWAPAADLNAGTPGGTNGMVQFNNAGAFGGVQGLFWDNTNSRLSVNGLSTTPLQSYLNVRQTLNPMNTTADSVVLANLGIDVRQENAANNYGGGIKFSIGNTLGYTGTAAIVATRTGYYSQGDLHFAVNNAGVSGKTTIPIRMTIKNTGRVGIGTTSPDGKLEVKQDAGALDTEPLFEVKNKLGQTVFVVYPDSVHVYVKDMPAKSNQGGFAVSGRNNSKALTNDYLNVNPSNTKVWTQDTIQGFDVKNIAGTTKLSYLRLTPKNYFIGHEAGKLNNTGSYNSFMGYNSGYSNVSGNFNVFLGYKAGYYNTASYNFFMGYEAGKNNTSGTNNSFIGYRTGYSNNIADNNTAIGPNALYSNTSGSNNTAIGPNALYTNTTAVANIAIGPYSLTNSNTDDNIAIGNYALTAATTGIKNISIGSTSLMSLTTGEYNTAVGVSALRMNVSGSYNVAVGFNTGRLATGSNNVFMGYHTGFNSVGSYNILIGYDAGYNTSGDHNIFMGYYSGRSNTSGSQNTAVGYQALYTNTTSNYSTAIGAYALHDNTGNDNTAVGNNVLPVNSSGVENAAFGSSSLQHSTTGDKNSAFGIAALYNNITGSQNTAVGNYAFFNGTAYSNSTALGYNAAISASNQVRIGNSSVASAWVQVAWSIGSDVRIKNNIQENIPGLSFISLLRPVSYNYDINKENEILGIKDSSTDKSKYDIEKIKFSGFIAQEVDAAATKIGYDFSGVDKSGKLWGLRYSEFTVPLVKAVQELNAKNEELKLENENLIRRIEALEKVILKK